MPIIDYTNREVVFRVAACGPAAAGKTTLLWQLHAQMSPAERGEMSIRAIGADQLVSFDCAASDLVPIGDYRARIHLFTVPGRTADPAVWARVMGDVDGILFVADSQFERMGENVVALRTLAELPSAAAAPVVFLYNKRDLSNCAPVDYIDAVINKTEPRFPRYEGVLSAGTGAKESLAMLLKLIIQRAAEQEADEARAAEPVVVLPESGSISEVAIPAPRTPVPPAMEIPATVELSARTGPLDKPEGVFLDGGCLCGAIRYRLPAHPREVFFSHSAEFRRAHGAPLVAWMAYAPQDFFVLQGFAKEFCAGSKVRSFCPGCGSQLTFRDLGSDVLLIAAGSLDTPELLAPSRHESAAEALPWLKVYDGLPRSS